LLPKDNLKIIKKKLDFFLKVVYDKIKKEAKIMIVVNENNIYEKGVLINLNMGAFSGRKKLSADQLENLPKEIVRGVHDLFEKSFKLKLNAVDSHDSSTRDDLKYWCIPFPLKGVYFLPSDRIEKVISFLEERKSSRQELIKEILDGYEDAKAVFAEKYPEYYKRAQNSYPSKSRLASRFYFEYQFLKISAPDNNSLISPEQYRKEMEKFRETINEMKQEVVSIVYQSLSDLTNRLKKQSKDGKMNQRTFNSLHKFLEQVDSTYTEFIDRKDLQDTLEKVKAEIKGMSADMLRDNDAQREKFHKAISALTNEIQALPDVEAKRAIDF
jgi:hypothetical protein